MFRLEVFVLHDSVQMFVFDAMTE